jgi:hypothetical protein
VPTTQSTPDAVRKSLEAAAEASRDAAEQRALDKELEELRKRQEEDRKAEEEAEQQEEEEEPASAYYSSCADARAAGAAPMRRGEPGYRAGLDRDNDGIACDT